MQQLILLAFVLLPTVLAAVVIPEYFANLDLKLIICTLTLLILISKSLYWLYTPLNFFYDKTVKEKNHRHRKIGKLPPPYPNGWYHLLLSKELKVGDVQRVDCFGQSLVLFRGNNGKPHVLDAYCPHLGANLGNGGRVVDNCLQCPFHGWKFNGAGECVEIPYSDKIPSNAKTKSWPALEQNGHIIFYYHVEGKEPDWIPSVYKEIEDGSYQFIGLSEHRISAHIQEIPENGADVSHLHFLHPPFIFNIFTSLFKHEWTSTWAPGEGSKSHTSDIELTQCLKFNGKVVPFSKVSARIKQIGPGLVPLELCTSFGKMIVIETVTPLAPLEQRARHFMYAEKRVPSIIKKLLFYGLVTQFGRDVPIWSNKTFLHAPLIPKEDSKIKHFRRWYSQFYTDKQKQDAENNYSHSLSW
eukprot:TRINITY_DN9813_c0_g1_i1.p1 TRINITY_DN9813_c0_g1~~TRINITY_DN9813_c0_g1_i1.p1  ORF type:complete len:412 (+),score=50.32 TRINITY_DN9813_c0_g1_i1:106-1341(+)